MYGDLIFSGHDIHRVSKRTCYLWLAITWHPWTDFDIFLQKSKGTLLYTTSNNLCFCTIWQNGETRKFHFHSNAVLVHCQNSSSRCLISSIFLTHTPAALWLPKSCHQCAQFGTVGGIVQEKESREHCSSWTVLYTQCTSVLSSGFPLLQGNSKALDRWGGKMKHHLIFYFLKNTSAKNYHNRVMYVKIIASQRWDFFETQCTCFC